MTSTILRVAAFTALALGSLPAQATRTPAAQVTVTRSRESTPLRIVLIVRIEGQHMTLGSYQGKLTFDASAFAVDSATVNNDGSRFVNAAMAGKGEVRFAGFTTNGFKGADAVRIVGHASKPLDAAKISAMLTVAGDIDGKAVHVINSTKVDTDK